MAVLGLIRLLASMVVAFWCIWIGCVVIAFVSGWYWLADPRLVLLGTVVIVLVLAARR